MPTLVTGAAGFIGYHVAAALLARGDQVVGLDNLSDYYDPRLKQARLDRLRASPGFTFMHADIADADAMRAAFAAHRPERVVHLAAQAGVRYSISHPEEVVRANVVGFLHILEGCRTHQVRHLVFASSSSVYGANTAMPWTAHRGADHPITLYGATKKSNEMMAHSYAHLFGLPATGLRFFTVYGPWGRPDMAPFKFAQAILEGRPIDIYNEGRMRRDFTYIDDITEGVVRALDLPPAADAAWDASSPDPASSSAPFRLYNIGNNRPTELLRFIELLEQAAGRPAIRNLKPMQPGDMPATWADVDGLAALTGYAPRTTVEQGVPRLVAWHREYHGV